MFWLAVFVFMLFSAIAVMNMMIGVLVEAAPPAGTLGVGGKGARAARDR